MDDLRPQLEQAHAAIRHLVDRVVTLTTQLERLDVREPANVERELTKPRFVAMRTAGWKARTTWLTRRRAAVIGWLAVLGLIFVVARTCGNVVQVAAGRPVTPAPPLAAPDPVSPAPIVPVPLVAATASDVRPVQAPARTPSRREQPQNAPLPPREFMGSLVVASDPTGAAVYINRQRVGETPVQVPRLSAGSHAVWVDHEGYDRWTASVLVPADKVTQVEVTLQPARNRPSPPASEP